MVNENVYVECQFPYMMMYGSNEMKHFMVGALHGDIYPGGQNSRFTSGETSPDSDMDIQRDITSPGLD